MKNDKLTDKEDMDILSALESDINRDWDDISKDIQKEQEEKEIRLEKELIEELLENPRRMDFPNFSEFYELMAKLYHSYNENEVRMLIHHLRSRMFNPIEEMPKAFEHIWDAFCNPREYDCETGIPCRMCKNRWDVFFKRYERRYERVSVDVYGDMYYQDHLSVSRINCPICNHSIAQIKSDDIIGIFRHKHVNEAEEYRHYGGNLHARREREFNF